MVLIFDNKNKHHIFILKKESKNMCISDITSIMQKASIETYGKIVEYKQLYHCSAHYYETENYYILRSYNTNIAIYDKNTNKYYDFLRAVYGFTRTSSMHNNKMMNFISAKNGGKDVEYIRIEK